ncbi:hypothetical protein ABZ354_17470 [Streptomyces sp. NPDC005925]|uniref:hypothetical protein n=1 Tax=Streptomyces sp. NPDC005925 TaxID=3157172 RepID=UPI0033DC8618
MPLPPPSRMPPGPRRRSLLASAAGAVLLAGCSDGSDSPGAGGHRTSAAGRARARAARDSRGLVEHYDAVLAAHPGLAERLTPLRGEVARHAAAFEAGEGRGVRDPVGESSVNTSESAGEAGSRAAGGSSGSPSPAPSGPDAPGVVVPGNEKDALAQLAAAERVLVERRSRALLDAPGELARLLASVAASGAAHVYLLTEGDR